jgi:hypothetical protein
VKGKAIEERDREMKANLVKRKRKKKLTSALNFERRLCLYPLCGCQGKKSSGLLPHQQASSRSATMSSKAQLQKGCWRSEPVKLSCPKPQIPGPVSLPKKD